MWKFTWAQMRRHTSRLVAAGLAIVLSTGFVAAAVTGMSALNGTIRNAFAAELERADLAVTVSPDPGAWSMSLPPGTEGAARRVAGVASTYEPRHQNMVVTSGDYRESVTTQSRPEDPAFLPDLLEGNQPQGDSEVLLGSTLAGRLGRSVGDSVLLKWSLAWPDNLSDAEYRALADRVKSGEIQSTAQVNAKIVGLFDDNALDLTGSLPDIIGLGQSLDPVTGFAAFPPADTLLVRLVEGSDPASLATAIQSALAPIRPPDRHVTITPAEADGSPETTETESICPADGCVWTVETQQAMVDRRAASYLGSASVLTAAVGSFVAIALVVAGLVISNTLQVLIAQRTRTLSLLRCVGATKRQVRSSVLGEAAVLGGVGGVGGIVVGILLVQLGLLLLGRLYPAIPVPTVVAISPWAIVLPLVTGLTVTLIAALVPARLATRVAPIAALRPQTAPSLGQRAGRTRLVITLVSVLGGLALLTWAALRLRASVSEQYSDTDYLLRMGLGGLGGAVFFIGVIIGTVFWVPRVVGWVGTLIRRTGPGARIAAANTVRNPRRTAATATALVVGVTLVAAVGAGAASLQSTFSKELDRRTPIDVIVISPHSAGSDPDSGEGGLPTDLVAGLRAEAGLADVMTVPSALLPVRGAATPCPEGDCDAEQWEILGVDPARAADVLHGDTLTAPLAAGDAIVPRWVAQIMGVTDGHDITVSGSLGEVTLRARVIETFIDGIAIPLDRFQAVGSGLELQAWGRLAPNADAATVVGRIDQLVGSHTDASGNPPMVSGLAKERAWFTQILNTLLVIVTALFGVAVVIAFVGVANTLSLSVIERRRESALLRALGLTKGQMRGMLAIEGVIIAGVGAATGIVLGVGLGWTGAYLLLVLSGAVSLSASVIQIGATLAVAVAAGLIASVLPGRAAANAQPALALASE
jgi:putative ABC transport system permease protein